MSNTPELTPTSVTIGIDISKAAIDIASEPPGAACCGKRVYSDEQVERLCRELAAIRPAVIVVEATGRLEALLAHALQAAGLRVAVVNPKRARDFANAEGTHAKTDPIDAGVLARYGRAMRPEPRPLPEALTAALQELVSRRRQLIAMRDAERHRIAIAARLTPAVRNDIVEHIKELDKRLASIDKDIDQAVASNPAWTRLSEVLTSVPGIGPVARCTLLAELPELGRLNRKQIAKLVGLAPFDRQSGKYNGPKAIWGGRAKLRATLYMAALVATQRNPPIKAFYQRLLAAGKAKKVALTACMHKLLTILNTLARTQSLWNHNNTA